LSNVTEVTSSSAAANAFIVLEISSVEQSLVVATPMVGARIKRAVWGIEVELT
jgi:hypothetical protein